MPLEGWLVTWPSYRYMTIHFTKNQSHFSLFYSYNQIPPSPLLKAWTGEQLCMDQAENHLVQHIFWPVKVGCLKNKNRTRTITNLHSKWSQMSFDSYLFALWRFVVVWFECRWNNHDNYIFFVRCIRHISTIVNKPKIFRQWLGMGASVLQRSMGRCMSSKVGG